jgi:hypothetical protein
VTLRARWVTLRARWVTLRARWVTLRARWVTFRCALGEGALTLLGRTLRNAVDVRAVLLRTVLVPVRGAGAKCAEVKQGSCMTSFSCSFQ